MGISIFEYRYTEIVFIDVLNTEIPKFKPHANFSIIPKYRNSSKANFSIIPKYLNSIKANFGFSEIGNALRNHLLSATTHIQIKLTYVQYIEYNTLYTKRICIASHGAQRVANRFCNNMSMTLFQAFPPSLRISDTLQSMRCTGGKHSHWHIIAESTSIRNTLCAVSCNAYSFSV